MNPEGSKTKVSKKCCDKLFESSKSNGLPDWDLYFAPLCKLEYVAYSLSKEKPAAAEAFARVSKYHLNSAEVIRTLYCDGLSEEAFGVRLGNIIRPIYDAARDSGFKEWKYGGTICQ